MNIAIGGGVFKRNSRVGIGLILAAFVAAAVLAGIWQASDSGPARMAFDPSALAPAPVAVPSQPATRALSPEHYYLVNSQDQIDGLVTAEFEASNASGGRVTQIIHIIDVRTPDGEALARALQEDLYLAATDSNAGFDPSLVQVHDLTLAPIPTITSKEISTRTVSDPRDKLFIVGSETEKAALLYEADVAAAFEGSEFVAPNVMVVETPEQESLYQFMMHEQGAHPDLPLVIDLRK